MLAQEALKRAEVARYAKDGEVSILRKTLEKVTNPHSCISLWHLNSSRHPGIRAACYRSCKSKRGERKGGCRTSASQERDEGTNRTSSHGVCLQTA